MSWDIENKNVKKREIAGLVAALKEFHLRSGLVITEDYKNEERADSKIIKYIPLWKWLLGDLV